VTDVETTEIDQQEKPEDVTVWNGDAVCVVVADNGKLTVTVKFNA
jgi:hypothetical protein